MLERVKDQQPPYKQAEMEQKIKDEKKVIDSLERAIDKQEEILKTVSLTAQEQGLPVSSVSLSTSPTISNISNMSNPPVATPSVSTSNEETKQVIQQFMSLDPTNPTYLCLS